MKLEMCEKLRCLCGQPVRIFTDDERIVRGMVVGVNDEFVRVHGLDGDIFLVSLCHIDTIEEPHMHLNRPCREKRFCEKECEEDCCGEDEECDEFERGDRRRERRDYY